MRYGVKIPRDVVRSDVFYDESVGVPMGGFSILDLVIRNRIHPEYIYVKKFI